MSSERTSHPRSFRPPWRASRGIRPACHRHRTRLNGAAELWSARHDATGIQVVREDRGHRPGLRRPAGRPRLRAQVPHSGLRHQRAPRGAPVERAGRHRRDRHGRASLLAAPPDDEPRGPARYHLLRGGGADPDRQELPAGPEAARVRVRERRQGAGEGRRGRLRVDGLPGRDRGGVRPGAGARLRAHRRRRLRARLLAGAHQPGRPRAHLRADHQGRLGSGRGDTRAGRRRVRGRGHRRRAPRTVHQGRRGGQGHREHAARPQHRAHERARPHLRPARHPHERRARGRGDQVELPPLHARPGRRPLSCPAGASTTASAPTSRSAR